MQRVQNNQYKVSGVGTLQVGKKKFNKQNIFFLNFIVNLDVYYSQNLAFYFYKCIKTMEKNGREQKGPDAVNLWTLEKHIGLMSVSIP